jgi:membrane peptidoglycan carboxypeptidase
MYQVTQPGLYHTAGGEHLEGIDFGGKTGTAQVMSHQALDKTNKAKSTNPNVWFVGVTPTRNPELVVAVLWQNGNKSWFAARIGARVVSAYVEKQRRLQGNLVPVKAPATPVEMSAVWTSPGTAKLDGDSGGVATGQFLVQKGEIVPPGAPNAHPVAERERQSTVAPKSPSSSRTQPPGTASPAGSGKGQ